MMFIIMYYTENACFPFGYRLEVKSVESVASEVISLPSSEEDGDTAVISGMDSSIRNASRSDQPSKGQSVRNTVFKVQLRVLFHDRPFCYLGFCYKELLVITNFTAACLKPVEYKALLYHVCCMYM